VVRREEGKKGRRWDVVLRQGGSIINYSIFIYIHTLNMDMVFFVSIHPF
jgi:hypothetical protein